MAFVGKFATGEQVAWGVMGRHSVSGREGIEPKDRVLDEVHKHQSGNAGERQHPVGAACAILYRSYITLDVRNMLICRACLTLWKHGPEGFELVIAKDAPNFDSAMSVGTDEQLQLITDS